MCPRKKTAEHALERAKKDFPLLQLDQPGVSEFVISCLENNPSGGSLQSLFKRIKSIEGISKDQIIDFLESKCTEIRERENFLWVLACMLHSKLEQYILNPTSPLDLIPSKKHLRLIKSQRPL